MKASLIVFVLFSIFVISSVVNGQRKWRSYVDLHRHHEKFLFNADKLAIDLPPFQWYNQTLNHFDEQDKRTWLQRYVINSTFWDGKGPVFFMINGEGPMSQSSVTAFQYVTWAQEFKALIISLEHRFYGQSQPFSSLSTENLVYLDADQALADAANFRQYIANKFNAHKNQFITFGGSYAGELSGWMREKYPHLISASIASSGPVNAEVDFYQYLAVVQDSLKFYGSDQCVSNIALATAKIQALTKDSDGISTLSKMFNTCSQMTQNDIPNFMQSLAGNFMGIVQYNLEFPGTNITTLCNTMTNSTQDPLTNYLDIWNYFLDGECADVAYGDMIEELKNTTVNFGVGGRQWFYQTCIEFGYFQTSDSPNQPFGDLFNLSTQTQQCIDVFGFKFLPDVNWTKVEYGGNEPDGSNILWVNGLIDPWHALGVLEAPQGAPFNILVINGTAHCADMMPPYDGAPKTLPVAQEVIRQQLSTWISAYNSLHH